MGQPLSKDGHNTKTSIMDLIVTLSMYDSHWSDTQQKHKAGNSYQRGRLSSIELLVKIACLVK
jgi:hypothetical protein